ncbi:MAG: EAL domain-containing protein [Synergistaceae bacterium]|jgi:lactose/cellobiose-specific phosphotransferase system IIC component|nr:EAL domain-containing protein [Synergistaceae bacterium]
MKISSSPYLAIVRDSLTLVFPLIITGAAAILINNFPILPYQSFMEGLFGPNWRVFGGYVWGGTMAVISLITVFSIGYGVAELYNAEHRLDSIHPLIVGLVSFCSLMSIAEPANGVFAVPYEWLGMHGLFLAIIVALLSSSMFLKLYDLKFRMRFFIEAHSAIMVNAFSALLPGAVTIFAFAAFKVLMGCMGVQDVHRMMYDMLCRPFAGMGNTVGTALLYNFVRQLLWFLGIHGSNALGPVMTEIYEGAAAANEAAAAAGLPPPYVFTKTFFDTYTSMGGAGNTLSLMLALILTRGDGGLGKIAKLSLIPAFFNINETLLFGLPIVLNPIYFIPFTAVPIILTVISYIATVTGLVPAATAEAAWTTPILVSGYVASGGVAGGLLQLLNLLVGALIYLPFVRAQENVQRLKFDEMYKELLRISSEPVESFALSLVTRTDDVGSFSRALANDLLQSLDGREVYLEYQPQVDCRTGRVVGVEALARWRHGRIGRVPPSLFVPLSEEIGFINELGLWVCDESCRQMREWEDKGVSDLVMSFNVSVMQLDDPDLPERIEGLIRHRGLAPECFKAEVTESVGLSPHMGRNVLLQDMKRIGLSIAIDDFGMGHSSLVYLKQFPVNTLKLDGSLVKDVAKSKVSYDIIATISELCRSMDIHLLAEFVETEDQARALKELGCFIFQGYLYSPPLSPEKCLHAIRNGFRTY